MIGVSEPVESSSNGAGLVPEAMAPLLLTVNQAAAALGIGRSTMYTLMYRGDIRPSTSDAVFGSIPRTSSSSWLVCHATGSERKVGDHRDLATVLVYRIAPRH